MPRTASESHLDEFRDHLSVLKRGETTTEDELRGAFPRLSRYALRKVLEEQARLGVVRSMPRRGWMIIRQPPSAIIGAMLLGRHCIESHLMSTIVRGGLDASPLRDRQADLEDRAEALRGAIKIQKGVKEAARAFVSADMDMHGTLCDICEQSPLRLVIEFMRVNLLTYLIFDVQHLDRIDDILREHRAWSKPLFSDHPPVVREAEAIAALADHLEQSGQRARLRDRKQRRSVP